MTRKREKVDTLMGYLHANPHGISYVAGYLEGLLRDFLTEDQVDKALAPFLRADAEKEGK